MKVIRSSLTSGTTGPRQMVLATTMRDEVSLASFMERLPVSGLRAELLGTGDLGSLSVRFQHHIQLDEMRGSILLHRITSARDATHAHAV